MGNTFATSGGLFIHTDKGSYFPGEMVTGKVFMNVAHTLNSREVKLTVRGRERVQWTDPSQTAQHHPHVAGAPGTYHTPGVPGQPGYVQNQHAKPHWGSKEFFKVSQSLPQLTGHLNQGQYEVPFSFQLPHGLPASVDIRGSAPGASHFAAVIAYTIKAQCDVSGALDFSHKVKLPIGNCYPMCRGPVSQDKEEKVKRMGLMSLGKVHTKVHVPRTEMVPGESLSIRVEVKNDTSADIQKAKLRLWRTIHIHDSGIGHRKIEQKAASIEGHKIGAHSKKTDGDALNLTLNLPHDLPPESKGNLVNVTYRLVLSMDISMASDPSIEIPVSIFQPQQHHWAPQNTHQLPQGWNPHVLAPVGFGAFAAAGLPPPPTGSPIAAHPGHISGPAPPSFTPAYTPGPPPQAGYPPAGSPHAGYPPAGAPPPGYPPAGYPPPGTRDAGNPVAPPPSYSPTYTPSAPPQPGYPGAPPIQQGYPPAGAPPAGYPQAAPVGYPGVPPTHDHHGQPQYTPPGAGAPPSSTAAPVYPPPPGVQADPHHGHH